MKAPTLLGSDGQPHRILAVDLSFRGKYFQSEDLDALWKQKGTQKKIYFNENVRVREIPRASAGEDESTQSTEEFEKASNLTDDSSAGENFYMNMNDHSIHRRCLTAGLKTT